MGVGRDAADGEPDPQPDGDVLNEHVFSAVGEVVGVHVGRFGDNNVVIVLAGDVEDMEVSAAGVDAVGVEWEHGDDAVEVVPLYYVQLRGRVHFYVQVEHPRTHCLVCVYVVAG